MTVLVLTSTAVQHAGILVLAVLFGATAVLSAIDKALGRPVRTFTFYASAVVSIALFAALLS